MEAPITVGQIVAGKYSIERIIARGGGGIVVQAKHLQLREPCAIKFMLPGALGTGMARERFLREARAVARLKSDHVVRIFDVDEIAAETPYIVMEYLEGLDLDALVRRRGPLPVPEAALYVVQICAALAEAHGLGIIHRDLKPANVFLTRIADGTPRIKLLDFGISKVIRDPDGLDPVQTLEGTILGSPLFMAPEQILGGEIDARTDLWAVGVILYHLLTGRLPFQDGVVMRSLAHILSRAAAPPSQHLPSLPPALERLILHCLEKRAVDRPASVTEIAAELAPFAAEDGGPLSLRVRRIFESASDGHVSSPDAPPFVTEVSPTLPGGVTPASLLAPSRRARPRWMGPVAVAVTITIVGLALAARTGPSPPAGAATAPDAASPAPAAPTLDAAVTSAPPPRPHREAEASSSHAAASAAPSGSRPTSFSPSAGFNYGDRR